ncbi:MAG: tetratricopeptide repeat protein [Acidobacteria bacterium]|nr:tetratricopeptide repeat protein [Acidobacteriota bacterium]
MNCRSKFFLGHKSDRPVCYFLALLLTALPALAQPAPLNNFGANAYSHGNFAVAESFYKSALAATAPNDIETRARIYSNLAALYKKQKRYVDSAGAYRKVLALRRQDAPPLAITLNNLAEVIRLQGDTRQAAGLYRRALAILGRHPDANLADLAAVWNNLGVSLGELGRLQEAEEALTKALLMKQKLFSPAHPELELTRNNLNRLHQAVMKQQTVSLAELWRQR